MNIYQKKKVNKEDFPLKERDEEEAKRQVKCQVVSFGLKKSIWIIKKSLIEYFKKSWEE